MLSTLVFYLTFALCACIGLPIALKIKELTKPSTSYVVGKVFGLLIFGYAIWLLCSLRILDYQNVAAISLLFFACVLAGLSALVSQFRRLDLQQRKRHLKTFLCVELTSLVLFCAYLYLRTFNVAIYGTKRFMDMALLTAAGKTHYFPFLDSWYAGKTVNYYYYGSYLMSLLANLSRTPYVLAYTSALALIYSTANMAAAALVYEITSSKWYAVLGAFFVTTSGMIFYAFGVLHGWWQIPPQIYSYASSTRLYSPSYIINEIPSYSFTVGDLHAHLLGLSFFLANLTVLYAFSKAKQPSWLVAGLLALGMASSMMIKFMDAITLCCLVLLVVLIKYGRGLEPSAKNWFVAGAGIAVGMLALASPFILNFHSPVLGIRFIPSYVAEYSLHNVQWPTPFWALVGEWGVFVAGVAWALTVLRKHWKEHEFPIALAVLSACILIGVEVFFVPDIYSVANPPYFRANTVFKFGYDAWSMLAIAFTVLLWAALNFMPSKKMKPQPHWAVKILLAVVIALALVYPYQAMQQYYGWFGGTAQGQTLDGMAFMKTTGAGDYEAVQWINANVKDRSVIVEAAGDSYTYAGRISVFTGMVDPINWLSHEWTWRLDAQAAKNARPNVPIETGYGPVATVSADVQAMYDSTDVAATAVLLAKYHVQYVYVGNFERTTYPLLDEAKFYQLGTIVYDANGVQIFKVARQAN